MAQAADLRGLSTRDVCGYSVFSVAAGNPGAGNHWVYTFTPSTPSKPIVLRVCFLEANLETATTLIGVRVGTATAKAASNLVFPFGDSAARMQGAFTVDEITNANLPLVLFNLFPSENTQYFAAHAPYPEYIVELEIGQNQVAEFIAMTMDDAFSLRLGWYTQPIV